MARVTVQPIINLSLSLGEARVLVITLNKVKEGNEFADAIDDVIKQFEAPEESSSEDTTSDVADAA